MNILFVTTTPLEYSSSANVRNIALIKGLVELGHEVSTCTAKPDEESSYYDNSLPNIKLKNKYYIELSKTHSSFTSKRGKSKSIKRVIKSKIYKLYNALTIYDPRKNLLAMINENFITESFDLIISSSDPKSSHLLAEKLLDSHPKLADKWLQYWGDPFTSDINNKSILPKWIIKKEEKRILEKSDAVIYVSPFTLQSQKELFPEDNEKFHFLPVPYVEKKILGKFHNAKFTVGYFGDYYSSDRDLLPLYSFASNNSELKLLIYGNSDLTLDHNENVLVNSRVSYDIVKENEQKCDLLICICNKTGTQIPGKIYHYAATNKPILIVLDGEKKEELRSYFESFERYYLCDNNEKSITEAINIIKNESKDYLPSPYFDPLNIAKKFMEIYGGIN